MLTHFFLVVLLPTEIGHLFWQNERIITQCIKICTLSCIRIKKYKSSFQFLSLLVTIVIRIWKAFLIFKFNSALTKVKFFNRCIRNSTLNFSSIDEIFSCLISTSSYLNTYLISWISPSFIYSFFSYNKFTPCGTLPLLHLSVEQCKHTVKFD